MPHSNDKFSDIEPDVKRGVKNEGNRQRHRQPSGSGYCCSARSSDLARISALRPGRAAISLKPRALLCSVTQPLSGVNKGIADAAIALLLLLILLLLLLLLPLLDCLRCPGRGDKANDRISVRA